ncbi:MAG TPA: tRNA pseudouridine(38-40) synthase TruA [Acidobacteriaceae bacterium]|nr:tRNA pseudouridine(38-40) synthase TruA [Acidobacteriaceae bacterium]
MESIGTNRVWKLLLAYDGTEFHGWQIQPGPRTIQGELRAAIARVTGEDVLPQGSGRTDAGVHAEGQVASFILSAPIPEANFLRALNRTLPPAIRVLRAERAPAAFHARHSANGKTYEYRIFRGEICPPWLARYAYAFPQPLDLAAMQRAAGKFVGEHDFSSFAASDPDLGRRAAGKPEAIAGEDEDLAAPSTIRTIHGSEWIEPRPQPSPDDQSRDPAAVLLRYRVSGNGFLHHMVRNLVGTLLEVGRGRLREDDIPRILGARARSQAGPTAPARGLFLMSVQYQGADSNSPDTPCYS